MEHEKDDRIEWCIAVGRIQIMLELSEIGSISGLRHRPSRPWPRASHKRGPPTFLTLYMNKKVMVKISIFCPKAMLGRVQASNSDQCGWLLSECIL